MELHEENLILYHGSSSGIKGRIQVDYSKNLCDFGKGFYLGDNEDQARNRICNNAEGVLYTFQVNIRGQRTYTFEDDALWALYIAQNRQKIDFSGYPRLLETFEKIDRSDIVIGLIADDKIARSYNNFIEGLVTLPVLSNSLKMVGYGRQYVIKTQKFCEPPFLKVVKIEIPDVDHRKQSLTWGRKIKKDMDTRLEKIQEKYRREGRFIDEILEDYRS